MATANRLYPSAMGRRRFAPSRMGRAVRLAAFAWGAVAAVLFVVLLLTRGVPRPPESAGIERNVQYAFLAVGIAGLLLAWRREGVGGALLVLAGIVLGAAASVRYHPVTSLGVSLIFLGPGFVFLGRWASRRPVQYQVSLAVLVLIALAGGGLEAQRLYNFAFGPAHPSSPLRAEASTLVEWAWSGAVTSSSATVKTKVTRDSNSVRLAISLRPDLADPIYSDYGVAALATNNRVVAMSVNRLLPGTGYYYAVEVDSELDRGRRGEFSTFREGAFSFTFAFGSDARTGSNGAVFDAIRAANPLFYLMLGDIHYADITTNKRSAFWEALDEVLSAPAQAALYRSVAAAYVWDDHDYGGDDSDSRSDSRDAARLAYHEYVPHYPFASGRDVGPVYQAFSVGRVRFILTDARSERDTGSSGSSRTLLGEQQKAWLLRELLLANYTHALIVWVNPDPWIAREDSGADDWGGFAAERRQIADFIAQHQINRLVMLGGDAHMIAIDDGTNSNYSSRPGKGFPVMHAAALDRPGSVKGGPYSQGAYPGAGQYGFVTIRDNGPAGVEVTLSGRNWTGKEIASYRFSVPAPPGLPAEP